MRDRAQHQCGRQTFRQNRQLHHFTGVNSALGLPESKKTRSPEKSPQTSRIGDRSFRAFPLLHQHPHQRPWVWDIKDTASQAFAPRHSGYSSDRQMACGVETAFRLTRRGAAVINHSAAAVSCAGSTHIPARGQALAAYRGNTTFCFPFPSSWFSLPA